MFCMMATWPRQSSIASWSGARTSRCAAAPTAPATSARRRAHPGARNPRNRPQPRVTEFREIRRQNLENRQHGIRVEPGSAFERDVLATLHLVSQKRLGQADPTKEDIRAPYRTLIGIH